MSVDKLLTLMKIRLADSGRVRQVGLTSGSIVKLNCTS